MLCAGACTTSGYTHKHAHTLMVHVTVCIGFLSGPSCKNTEPLECWCARVFQCPHLWVLKCTCVGINYSWKTVSIAFTDMTPQMICWAVIKPMTLIQELPVNATSFDVGHEVCEMNNNESQMTFLTPCIFPCLYSPLSVL